jgi:dTMP kinase
MTEEFDALSHLQWNSNGNRPVFQLSPDTRSQLLRWYSGNPFDTDEGTLKRALKASQWCEENSSIFEYPPEIRRAKLETGAQTLEISVDRLAGLMARENILHQPTRTCRLIAFEGIDDTQNIRQIDLLRDHLVQRQARVVSLACSDSRGFFSREIARLQKGGGEANEFTVDPKSMALWHALDRKACVSDVLKQAAADCVVISNRYTLSNAVYQSARSDVDLADWIFEMEHTYLGIPAPDMYLLLDMPPSFDRVEEEQSVGPGPRPGQKDKSSRLATAVRQRYRELALRFPQIRLIECMADSHKAKTPEEIHLEILAHLHRSELFG